MAVKKIYDNLHSLGPEDVTAKDPDYRPNWEETDPEAISYIRNKPEESTESTEATPEVDTANSVDLSKMTKLQLENYALENGVEGVDSSMTKADMIDAIEQR